MSEAAIGCPACNSPDVRRSRRVNSSEMMRMMFGVYPFRCNACGNRFWASVWLFSIWQWAKCPRCLNVSLKDWPKRQHHLSLSNQIKLSLGAKQHRCARCRYNFVSFRKRLPEYEDATADVDDLDFGEERTPGKPTESAH